MRDRRWLVFFAIAISGLACPLADLSDGANGTTDGGGDGSSADGASDSIANDGGSSDAVSGRFVQLASGRGHACVLDQEAGVICWGWNELSEISTDPGATLGPELVSYGLPPITSVRIGYQTVCALTNAQNVVCWGSNAMGSLGRNVDDPSYGAPLPVVDNGNTKLAGVLMLAGSMEHFCAATATDIYCWGRNDAAQCGVADASANVIAATPVQLPVGSTPVAIAAGDVVSFAILNIGGVNQIFGWGSNDQSQFGAADPIDASDPSSVPVALQNPPNTTGRYVEITAGQGPVCARTDAGEAWCWGGYDTAEHTPTSVPGVASPAIVVAQIAAGGDYMEPFTCFVDSKLLVRCFGMNTNGEMGIGFADASIPVDIPGSPIPGFTASEVSAGGQFVCAIDATRSSVWCWGLGHGGAPYDGELGNPDGGDSFVPIRVPIP